MIKIKCISLCCSNASFFFLKSKEMRSCLLAALINGAAAMRPMWGVTFIIYIFYSSDCAFDLPLCLRYQKIRQIN